MSSVFPPCPLHILKTQLGQRDPVKQSNNITPLRKKNKTKQHLSGFLSYLWGPLWPSLLSSLISSPVALPSLVSSKHTDPLDTPQLCRARFPLLAFASWDFPSGTLFPTGPAPSFLSGLNPNATSQWGPSWPLTLKLHSFLRVPIPLLCFTFFP